MKVTDVKQGDVFIYKDSWGLDHFTIALEGKEALEPKLYLAHMSPEHGLYLSQSAKEMPPDRITQAHIDGVTYLGNIHQCFRDLAKELGEMYEQKNT